MESPMTELAARLVGDRLKDAAGLDMEHPIEFITPARKEVKDAEGNPIVNNSTHEPVLHLPFDSELKHHLKNISNNVLKYCSTRPKAIATTNAPALFAPKAPGILAPKDHPTEPNSYTFLTTHFEDFPIVDILLGIAYHGSYRLASFTDHDWRYAAGEVSDVLADFLLRPSPILPMAVVTPEFVQIHQRMEEITRGRNKLWQEPAQFHANLAYPFVAPERDDFHDPLDYMEGYSELVKVLLHLKQEGKDAEKAEKAEKAKSKNDEPADPAEKKKKSLAPKLKKKGISLTATVAGSSQPSAPTTATSSQATSPAPDSFDNDPPADQDTAPLDNSTFDNSTPALGDHSRNKTFQDFHGDQAAKDDDVYMSSHSTTSSTKRPRRSVSPIVEKRRRTVAGWASGVPREPRVIPGVVEDTPRAERVVHHDMNGQPLDMYSQAVHAAQLAWFEWSKKNSTVPSVQSLRSIDGWLNSTMVSSTPLLTEMRTDTFQLISKISLWTCSTASTRIARSLRSSTSRTSTCISSPPTFKASRSPTTNIHSIYSPTHISPTSKPKTPPPTYCRHSHPSITPSLARGPISTSSTSTPSTSTASFASSTQCTQARAVQTNWRPRATLSLSWSAKTFRTCSRTSFSTVTGPTKTPSMPLPQAASTKWSRSQMMLHPTGVRTRHPTGIWTRSRRLCLQCRHRASWPCFWGDTPAMKMSLGRRTSPERRTKRTKKKAMMMRRTKKRNGADWLVAARMATSPWTLTRHRPPEAQYLVRASFVCTVPHANLYYRDSISIKGDTGFPRHHQPQSP